MFVTDLPESDLIRDEQGRVTHYAMTVRGRRIWVMVPRVWSLPDGVQLVRKV